MMVTGGAGFIGSHYVRSVLTGAWGLTEPVRVVVLDKLTYAGNLRNLDPVAGDDRLRFVHGDVCDAVLVDSLVADADAVVHFAAESHVDRSLKHARDFVETNVLGGLTVPLYGDGLNVRDWLHVDDHCRGVHLVLTEGPPSEVYNIGGGTELTNQELT